MGRPLEGMLVVSVEDFSRHPHLRRITVETPQGAVRLPPAPAMFEEERPPGQVPALGEHTAAVRAESTQ